MANVRVRMNSAGSKAILTSQAVANELGHRAEAIARSACSKASPDEMDNDPFSANLRTRSDRVVAFVGTSSPHGIYSNNKNSTLLRSLDAGR